MDALLLSQEETFENMIGNIKVEGEQLQFDWILNPLFSSEFVQKFNEYINTYPFPQLSFSSGTSMSETIRHVRKSIVEKLKEKFYIDPLTIKAYQYDIVCNGIELSSGAIRNHKLDIMFKAFEIAGYSEADVREKFAGMVKAFSYGAPPHGGFAPGVDRMVMLLAGTDSIRDIIPFPLNGKAQDLLMNAPSEVSEKQLRELGIQIRKKSQE
jgi:aspartyl-tRNA synthetase